MMIFRRFLRLGLGTIGSVIGIVSGGESLLNNRSGASGGTGPGGATYVPQNRPGVDTQWQQIMQQLAPFISQEAKNTQGPLNNAYAATQPGGQWGWLQQFMQQGGSALLNQAQLAQQNESALSGAGNQVWQTSLDPQNALRDKLQQQVTDASRAGTSARGIGMSGEAAGIENNDVNNFLINWQNQQLGRQLAGLQGFTGATNASATQANQAGKDITGAGGMFTTGMDLPFATANSYTSASNPLFSQFGTLSPQLLSYLNLSNSSTGPLGTAQGQGLTNLAAGLSGLSNSFTQPAAPISDQSGSNPPPSG